MHEHPEFSTQRLRLRERNDTMIERRLVGNC